VFVHVLHPTGSFLSVFSGAFQGKPMVVVLVDNLREAGFESKIPAIIYIFRAIPYDIYQHAYEALYYYYSCITSICVLLLLEP
jgi:hypothetical protein